MGWKYRNPQAIQAALETEDYDTRIRLLNGLLAVLEDPFNPPGRLARRYRGQEYPAAMVANVADGWELVYLPHEILAPLAKVIDVIALVPLGSN